MVHAMSCARVLKPRAISLNVSRPHPWMQIAMTVRVLILIVMAADWRYDVPGHVPAHAQESACMHTWPLPGYNG